MIYTNQELDSNKLVVPNEEKVSQDFSDAMRLIDEVLLKNYMNNLSEMDTVPMDDELVNNVLENIRLFKINEMVYQKDEYSSSKFSTVFSSLQDVDCSVVLLIDSHVDKTDFYLGVHSQDENRTVKSIKDTLKNSLNGQFPGTKTTDLFDTEINSLISTIKPQSIASVTCIAGKKNDDEKNNKSFLQGIDKLVLSMQGKEYTGIIIADSARQMQIGQLKKQYENIYSQLCPFANMQASYGVSESFGISNAISNGVSYGQSYTNTNSYTEGSGTTQASTSTRNRSKNSKGSKTIKGLAAGVGMVGAALVPFTGGASVGVGVMVSSALGLIGSAAQNTVSSGESETKSTNISKSRTDSTAKATNSNVSQNKSYTESSDKSDSKTLLLDVENKTITNILEKLDIQLKRLEDCESMGMWECAAYFLSENQESAEMAAKTYKSLMNGINSGVEVSAINIWRNNRRNNDFKNVSMYLTNFIHPRFNLKLNDKQLQVTPCSYISTNEMAIHMGLPRRSVCGLPVVEHASFGMEVVKDRTINMESNTYSIGKVLNMGTMYGTKVNIDRDSLTMHTLITGTTGAGKSNTVYNILGQLSNDNIPFLVIEPAKGQYKHIFGNDKNVTVFGTNPQYTELLRINPFKFPPKIHIFEHIDRLIEIFNVCWPMYAAMSAILKDAVLQAYERCGWVLDTSTNIYSNDLFPTFADLEESILRVIQSSAYSQEVKSNYIGSLLTRVKMLTNGLNGQIFSSNEIDNTLLFDRNVIIDLSRVGAFETKSLIMGILIIKLNEYRSCYSEGMNLGLKHVTVLEEAHNILKRDSGSANSETSNIAGKSVEILSNSIAEMRTYGEGFIIADQSPTSIDISAIRNTNTKIIMRLPDETDRLLVGKSSALNTEQLDEIAKLPKGAAVIYQNDWLEPVLTMVNRFGKDDQKFRFEPVEQYSEITKEKFKTEVIKFLLSSRIADEVDGDIVYIENALDSVEIPTNYKIILRTLINEYKREATLNLWEVGEFGNLSNLVTTLLNVRAKVRTSVINASNFYDLNLLLTQVVAESVPQLSEQMTWQVCHCLMREMSNDGEVELKTYAAWTKFMNDNGGIQ